MSVPAWWVVLLLAKMMELTRRRWSCWPDASLESLEETRKVIVGWQRQGLTLSQIYLNGIAESAKALGDHWLSDKLSFVECTIGFSRLHQMLHDYSAEFVTEGRLEPNGYTASCS